MEPITLTVSAALLMGLSFGSGPCNVTCLPFLGPVFLGQHDSTQRWKIIVLFSTGRISGYILLASAAALLGEVIQNWTQSPWAGRVLGLATIMVGISMLINRQKLTCSTKTADAHNIQFINDKTTASRIIRPGLFFMGMGLAFNPCAPLATLMLASATTASLLHGLYLGLGFGLGAVLIPGLIFGFLVAHFGQQIRNSFGVWQKGLTRVAGTALILLGLLTISGLVQV